MLELDTILKKSIEDIKQRYSSFPVVFTIEDGKTYEGIEKLVNRLLEEDLLIIPLSRNYYLTISEEKLDAIYTIDGTLKLREGTSITLMKNDEAGGTPIAEISLDWGVHIKVKDLRLYKEAIYEIYKEGVSSDIKNLLDYLSNTVCEYLKIQRDEIESFIEEVENSINVYKL